MARTTTGLTCTKQVSSKTRHEEQRPPSKPDQHGRTTHHGDQPHDTGQPDTGRTDSSQADNRHPYDDGHRLTPAVTAARDGNEHAFTTIYQDLHPRLLRQLRALVGDTDAHDVAAEVWLHIFTGLVTFHGGYLRFRLWAATIARRRAADHLRRIQPPAPLDPADIPDRIAPEDTERDALEALATAGILIAVKNLPRTQAQIVWLRTVLGLDAPATARVLDKRPGAVRTGGHRGLQALAGQLPHWEAATQGSRPAA